MSHKSKPIIHIIELDSYDARYQSGITRYLDILGEHMPDNVKSLRIICEFSPDIKNITIDQVPFGICIRHPAGFPAETLNTAIVAYVAPILNKMENIIIKCNCLGTHPLAYALRNSCYCHTIGVLHCVPHMTGPTPPINPFFNMDHIISVCDTGCGYLNHVQNKRPVTVIFNGIDTPKTRRQNRTNDGIFRFIFPGGWAPHKGFEKIIPAIERVATTHSIQVLVPGGGDVPKSIASQITDIPVVRCGRVNYGDEMDALYAQADCALFASQSEACSFAGIESMAHNLPIISVDVPGLREMFGPAAHYVPMNERFEINPDDYANKMIEMITNQRMRTRSAINAYARYIQKYTARRMVSDTLRLYNKVLGLKK